MEKLLRRGLVIGRRIEDFFSLSIFNNMVSFFFIEKSYSNFQSIQIRFISFIEIFRKREREE